MRRIGLLSAGGVTSGMNAVTRAIVKQASARGVEVIGFMDGFRGLVRQHYRVLDVGSISGILPRGGTILGLSNDVNPFSYEGKDLSVDIVTYLNELDVECLVYIGAQGSFRVARDLMALGMPGIGVPSSIDNDFAATDQTFGFDTAIAVATEALDRLHTTAESHHRIMILEVRGRHTGWIALHSGIAGDADAILVPEIPFRYDVLARRIRQRMNEGMSSSVIVVAEGAGAEAEKLLPRTLGTTRFSGGIGYAVGLALQELTGLEARVTVLGYMQPGGAPTHFDRLLATRYGVYAANLAIDRRYDRMVALRGTAMTDVPLEAISGERRCDADCELVRTAKAVGITFGDE